jgi:hypothetical protein
MAVPSQMVPLGTPAPDFALPDLSGTTVKLGDHADAPALLVMFACNHCPYVKHVESAVGRLLDESQDVARAYQAACTPDFFLYDADRLLAYRGSLDESTPGNGKPVTGERLRAAIDLVLSGRPVPEPQIPSMGCSIKFR